MSIKLTHAETANVWSLIQNQRRATAEYGQYLVELSKKYEFDLPATGGSCKVDLKKRRLTLSPPTQKES